MKFNVNNINMFPTLNKDKKDQKILDKVNKIKSDKAFDRLIDNFHDIKFISNPCGHIKQTDK